MPWDLFPFFMNLNSLDPERDRATRLLSSIFCSKDSTWAVMNRLKHFRKFFCFVKIFDYKVRKSPVNRAGRLRQFSRWRAKMSCHQKIVACRFFCWLFRCVVVVTLSLTWWNTFANLQQNINKCFLSWIRPEYGSRVLSPNSGCACQSEMPLRGHLDGPAQPAIEEIVAFTVF